MLAAGRIMQARALDPGSSAAVMTHTANTWRLIW